MKSKSESGNMRSISPDKSTDLSKSKEQGKLIVMHEPESEATLSGILKEAANAEQNENFPEAEKLYKKAMKQSPLNETAYNRLMIIYRKQKNFEEELKIINKGIDVFTNHYAKRLNKKNNNAQIKALSASLMKKVGLADKKGNALYDPEPVSTWKKRKLLVQKKLK